MSLIIIAAVIWGICKLISAASAASKERARQAQLERIRREQERVKLEQARQREAWKAAQAAERERVRQMVALEREQARQAKEQERLAKEQERMDAEIKKEREERIEADNKLQAQINKQNYRIEKAKSDIMFLQEDIETLTDLRHPKAMKLHELKNLKVKDDYRGIGNPARDAEIEKLTKQVRQYDKQIHAAQQKIDKANADKRDAEIKLREVA